MTAYWLFALSVLILIGATDQLIKLTTRLAVSLRLSPLIIGLTVVSLGTSTPELVVSVMAAYRGDYGLSVGNIIGSNTVNVFLVLALALIASQVRVGTTKTQRNNLLLLIISAVYLLSFYLHLPTYLVALGSIGLGLAFMILEYHWGVEGRHLEDKIALRFQKRIHLSSLDYLVLGASLIAIFFSGNLLVHSVEKIAQLTGLSTNLLGLSITAIATSLPEILATLFSARNHQEKLLLGNLIGSNVYNLLLIGGVSSFWRQSYLLPSINIVFFSLSVLVFFILVHFYRGRVIPRLIGLFLLILFMVYLFSIYA